MNEWMKYIDKWMNEWIDRQINECKNKQANVIQIWKKV